MPKGKSLTDEERKEICEARMLGESRAEIARAYGIAEASVTAIVRRYKQKENDMAQHECIVAGNKKTGRLVSLSVPNRYDGTCIIGGKAHTKSFTAANAKVAAEMWQAWCDELRKQQSIKPQPKPEPAKQSVKVEPVVEKPIVEKPVTQEQKEEVMGDKVYVIWAVGEKPKMFGAYLSMESALKEVDHLNEVAKFLVNDRVFEVEELALKS